MPPLTPGDELTGRYQLGRRLADDGLIETWTATDLVLTRSVEVEVLCPGTGTGERQAFLASAGAVARLSHPGIVNAYDTGVSSDGLPFLVTERSIGPSLAELIERHGPLGAARVVPIGIQIAHALDAAHRAGSVHGGIGAATIQVSEDDRAKLTGFTAGGIRARLAGATPDARADVDACARTLVTALLGEPADTTAAADSTAPVSPRAQRAGVAPSLDEILVAAQGDGPITSAGELAMRLERLELVDDARPDLDGRRTPPTGTRVIPPPVRIDGGRTGAVAGIVVGLLLTVGIAVAAFVLFGRDGGTPPPAPGEVTPTTLVPAPASTALAIVAAHSFDPFGDQTEREQAVNNVRDGNPATVWATEEYRSAHFGGLKSGVGVVLLLDAPHALSQLTVISPSRDWVFSVYVAATASPSLAGWGAPVVSATTVTAEATTVDLQGARGGAVLVWITALGPPLPHPADPVTPYQVAIGELEVH